MLVSRSTRVKLRKVNASILTDDSASFLLSEVASELCSGRFCR